MLGGDGGVFSWIACWTLDHGEVGSGAERSVAVFGGAAADPFFEGGGKGEGIVIADLVGDGFDFFIGGGEQVAGALHT